MPQNGMTSLAATNGQRQPQSTAGRPKFVEWTLRFVLCATDTRTDSGDLQRLINRAEDELSTEERRTAYATANAMLSQLKEGAGEVAELRSANEAVDREIAEKLRELPRPGALRGEWKS